MALPTYHQLLLGFDRLKRYQARSETLYRSERSCAVRMDVILSDLSYHVLLGLDMLK